MNLNNEKKMKNMFLFKNLCQFEINRSKLNLPESNENVDAINASDSIGGGGNENIESVMQDGIASKGLNGDDTPLMRSSCANDIVGVLGELNVEDDDACELSTEPRELLLLFGLRFNVLLLLPPQLLLSSLRRRL